MTLSDVTIGGRYTHPDAKGPVAVDAVLTGTAREQTLSSLSSARGTVVVATEQSGGRTHHFDGADFLKNAEEHA